MRRSDYSTDADYYTAREQAAQQEATDATERAHRTGSRQAAEQADGWTARANHWHDRAAQARNEGR